MKEFHRLGDRYFSKKTFIEYIGDTIQLVYSKKTYFIKWIKENRLDYRNTKVIYIPAERNFVAVIPNLERYAETNDNLLNFIYDWFDIKKFYEKDKKLDILDLGVKFYHSKSKKKDKVILNNGQELALETTSSGLQSLIPLVMLVDYLTSYFYNEKRPLSYEERESIINQAQELIDQAEKENQHIIKKGKFLELLISKIEYSFTQFIIEEPEQNLFPSAQKELIYYLLSARQRENRAHEICLTTHSPYVLYALNNCILGWIVKDKLKEEEKEKLSSNSSWIDPKLVSIWEIHDGKLKSIQDEDGMVSANYFDQKMKSIMDEFYVMLEYLED